MDYLALKMKDLESPEDVSFLVDVFYKKILEDETLSPFFAHIDFKKHKPRMEHFWNFVLFDKSGYTANVTDVHTSMKIKKAHFDSWVSIFIKQLTHILWVQMPKKPNSEQRSLL